MTRIIKPTAIFSLIALGVVLTFPKQSKRLVNNAITKVKSGYRLIYNSESGNKNSRFQPDKNAIWGIDISHHQASIDWNELKNHKPHFIYLKATEGSTHLDTKYKSYKKQSQNLDIPTGAYHFFSYGSSGKDQAKHFLKNAKVAKGDLIPVLDVEYAKNMPSASIVTKNILDFLKIVEDEIKVKPIIYCECDYYNQYLKKELKNSNTLWICDFYREPKCEYRFWQKTDKFEHPAFKGTIDYNIFTGSKNDLNLYILK